MSLSLLSNMWHNKGEVLDGLLSSFTNPTQEVELGADWDRDAAAHNIPVDAGLLAEDIKTIVSHPIVAANEGLNLLSGAVGNLLPEPVMGVLDTIDKKFGY